MRRADPSEIVQSIEHFLALASAARTTTARRAVGCDRKHTVDGWGGRQCHDVRLRPAPLRQQTALDGGRAHDTSAEGTEPECCPLVSSSSPLPQVRRPSAVSLCATGLATAGALASSHRWELLARGYGRLHTLNARLIYPHQPRCIRACPWVEVDCGGASRHKDRALGCCREAVLSCMSQPPLRAAACSLHTWDRCGQDSATPGGVLVGLFPKRGQKRENNTVADP